VNTAMRGYFRRDSDRVAGRMQTAEYAEKTTQLDWVRIVGSSKIMENAHIADEPIPPLAGENEWRRLFSRLDAISNLSDDWDGLGARAPAVEVVMTANVFLNEQRLLSALPPNCVVSASALGRISFEWELTGMYMEAEVDRPWHVSWMKQEANGQFQHWGHDVLNPFLSKNIGVTLAFYSTPASGIEDGSPILFRGGRFGNKNCGTSSSTSIRRYLPCGV
jgi:hypothetical protein